MTLPLAGRAILIARQPDRATGLAARLTTLGAAVAVAPVTTTAAPADSPALAAAVRRLAAGAYGWVVVTSVNAVQALTATAARLELAWPPPAITIRWAAVGPATAAALAALDRPVGLTPGSEASAAGLLRAFRRLPWPDSGLPRPAPGLPPAPGQSVLLPHGDLADPQLAQGLRDLGWVTEEVVAYRTVPLALPPGILNQFRAGGFDCVVVTAPSAVRSLAEQSGPVSQPAGAATGPGAEATLIPGQPADHPPPRLVAIGRSTAREVVRLGWPAPPVATTPTDEALVAAVIQSCGVGHGPDGVER